MSEERNEFTPDLFTLEDEDGNEQVFELLDVLEYEDNTYYALVPYYGDDEDALAQDDGEFVILKTEEVNGEEMLVSIEEDAEYETIGNNGCHSIAGRADASANRHWRHSKAAPHSPSRQRFLRQGSVRRNKLPQTASAHLLGISVRRCCIHGSLA